jgi:hypothetical protein
MVGMPYVMEKGPAFSVCEDYFVSIDRRLAFLANVRNLNVPLWDTVILESATLPATTAAHFKDHWLGAPIFNGTDWRADPLLAVDHTGWWHNWFGPAEGIIRESFERAIEVSLGIAHKPVVGNGSAAFDPPKRTYDPNTLPLSEVKRCWPVEILWACGTPTLQGWVTWRQHGTGWADGQVTLVFTTPGIEGYPMYADPQPTNPPPPPPTPAPPDYELYPGDLADAAFERGMWVIGARTTKIQTVSTTESIDVEGGIEVVERATGVHTVFAGPVSVILPKTIHFATDSAIDVVRPSETDGGVLNVPRKYVP